MIAINIVEGEWFLHRRNKADAQKNRIRGLIFSGSFHDSRRCETVCRTSRLSVLSLLDGSVDVSDLPDVVKGEVLVDSHGRGSFQL